MANRYWVGGTGTWDASSTTNWSASSGGASGASVPTSADSVFFNSASSATSYAVTISPTFNGIGSYSTITTGMTTVVTIVTATSGTLAVGDIVNITGLLGKITSFGTGSGGTGSYNCNVLYGGVGYGASGTLTASRQVCADINIAGPAAGLLHWTTTTGSLVEVAGSITTSATGADAPDFTITATGSASHTITSNGLYLLRGTASIYLSGTGTYTLGGALTCGWLYTTFGTFTTANFALTLQGFNQSSGSSSTKRTINLGSSTVTILNGGYPFGPVPWDSLVNLNAGTSTVNFAGDYAFSLPLGSKTWYNVTFTSTIMNSTYGFPIGYSGEINTFNNLSIAGQSAIGIVPIFIDATSTIINGTFTIGAAANATCRLFFKTGVSGYNTIGTSKTITAAAFAAGATDVDWRDITIIGAASPISGTRFGNCGGCSNITFNVAKTVYWNLANAQQWYATGWATSSGGSPAVNNFPLAQDTAVFDNTGSVTGTISVDRDWNIGTVDMSGRTSAMTLQFVAATINLGPTVYGSWTNGSGTTLTGTSSSPKLIFSNRSTKTINSAGIPFPFNVTLDSPGGGVQLLANWSTGISSASFILTYNQGTLDLNNFTLSHTGSIQSANFSTRVLAFGTTGVLKWISTASGSFNFSNFTNLSYTGTSSVIFDMSIASGSFWMAPNTQAQAMNVTITGSTDITGNLSVANEFKNLIFSSYTGTYSDGGYPTGIYGSVTLVSAMTLTSTGTWTFKSTSGTSTITSAGKTFPAVIFNGIGGTWQLQDAFTVGSGVSCSHANGTLDLNGKTLTVGTGYATLSGTKNITFNGGSIVCPAASAVAFNNATPTGFTTTAGTGMGYINMSAATAKSFVGGGSVFNCTLRQTGVGTLTITGANTFRSITNTVQPTTVKFTSGTTTTILDSVGFALNGTAGNAVTIDGTTGAAAFTITRAISGTNTNTCCSVSWMTGTTTATGGGSVTWQFTSSTDGGNNTNLSILSGIYYWVGGSGTWDAATTTNWSLTSGGAGNVGPPGSADQVIFDSSSSSGNYTVTIGTGATTSQVTVGAPASGKVTLAGSAALTLYGNLNLTGGTAGITNSYTGVISFNGTGTFTPNGVAFASNIAANASGIFLTLGSSLTTTGSFTVTQGTLSLGSYTLTSATFDSNNSNTRTLAFGTGNITTTGSGTAFTTATVTGLTVSSATGNPVVNISYSGSTATTVATGAVTEANAISFYFTGGTYTLSFLNSLNDRCYIANFTGFSGTWGTTNTCYIGGNLTLSSGMTLSASTGTCNFSTALAFVTRTITSNGKTLDFPIAINYPTTSTLQLADAMVVGATRTFTLSQGTLTLNNLNLTTGIFSSNANTRAITFGTGRIILTNGISGTTVLDMATATGFTSTGTGGFASAMNVNATFSLGSTAGSSTTAANLFLTGGSAVATLTTGSYFKTIDFTGYSGNTNTTTLYLCGYVLSAGGTFYNITARMIGDGSITSNGNFIQAIDVGYGTAAAPGYTSASISNTLLGTVGTAVTVTASGTGPVGAYAGSADDGYYPVTPGWNISFNNTNYATMYVGSNFYVTFGGGSGNYSGLSASNPAFPKIMMQAADRSMQRLYHQTTGTTPNRTFWWRHEGGTSTSATLGSPTMYYEGYLYENDPSTIDIVTGAMGTAGTTGVYSASALLLTVAGLGTATTGTRITYSSGAPTYPSPTTTIVDNLNVVGTLTFSSGTLTTISGNVNAGSFDASTATAKTLIMGSGTWTITGSGATAWNVTNPTFLTVTPGTSTIAMSSASAKTFVGSGKTWGTLTQTGAGTLTITGANTFNDLTASGSGRPSSILFTAGTTNTFTNFTLSGTAGNLVTVGSVTSALHTLSKSGGIVNASYLNISYSAATGGATWNALNSTDSGNNTGWTFSTPVLSSIGQLGLLNFLFP